MITDRYRYAVLELVRPTRTLPIGARLLGFLLPDGRAIVDRNGSRVVLPVGFVREIQKDTGVKYE